MLVILPEVERALARGGPVVALESTLICHGFPHPEGLAVGRELEATVRSAGAVPAAVAVLAGRLHIGLSDAQLVELAGREGVAKCSARDLPAVCARGDWGATTVAGTLAAAARVGIEVFATGGIGGVHRGAAHLSGTHPTRKQRMDVSADLDALARYPAITVCAGAKSLLDLGNTLEALETRGVPVFGWRTDRLPAFYSADSGLAVPHRVDDVDTLSLAWRMHRDLGLPGGILLCQPPPKDVALDHAQVEAWIDASLADAAGAGVDGAALTPRILADLHRLSNGRTLRTNRALARANAHLAAELAISLARPTPEAA